MARFTESFIKANNTTLGPDNTWTEGGANTSIVSNTARNTTFGSAGIAWASRDTRTTDQYIEVLTQISERVNGGRSGPLGRKDSSATQTFYLANVFWEGAGGSDAVIQLASYIGGVGTALDAGVNFPALAATNYRIGLEIDGATISSYVDGVLMSTVTDTSIAGASLTRGGFRLLKITSGSVQISSNGWELRDMRDDPIPFRSRYRQLLAQ